LQDHFCLGHQCPPSSITTPRLTRMFTLMTHHATPVLSLIYQWPPSLLLAPPPKAWFKHLTKVEITNPSKHGLCFNCDKQICIRPQLPSEIYGGRRSWLVSRSLNLEGITPQLSIEAQSAQLILNVLSTKIASNQTGQIPHHPVMILVDGWTTHNFIKDATTYALVLTYSPTSLLCAMVGNGEQLTCNQVCKMEQVLIQGQQLIVNLYLLEMGSLDVVQGVKYLKQLDPILEDYQGHHRMWNWRVIPILAQIHSVITKYVRLHEMTT